MRCRIDFEISDPASNGPASIGHCWHQMFKNPVLVSGFPILKRSDPELNASKTEPRGTRSVLGVEMALNLMAELTGAVRVVQFQGRLFIKGFSTMLVAMKALGNVLMWHYHFQAAKKRVSFLDAALDDTCAFEPAQLGDFRHVIGWSPDCLHYAGKFLLSFGGL